MIILLFFCLRFLTNIRGQCLSSCELCAPGYYDSNYLQDFQLSLSKSIAANCLPQNTSLYNTSILVTSLSSCSLESTVGYDTCYTNLLTAFESETRNSSAFTSGLMVFSLSSGTHTFNTPSTSEELFRQVNAQIVVGPREGVARATVKVMGNAMFMFAAGSLTIKNLDFQWGNIVNSSPPTLDYLLQNDQSYAFFNSEGVFSSPQLAMLSIQNCSFNGFTTSSLSKAWGKLFFLGYMGTVTINNCSFMGLSLPLGVLEVSNGVYSGVSGSFMEKGLMNAAVVINNSVFSGVNLNYWKNLGFIRLAGGGLTDFYIGNSVFGGGTMNTCFFCLTNMRNLNFSNCSLESFAETLLFQVSGVSNIITKQLYLGNITNKLLNIYDLDGISTNSFLNLFIENSNVPYLFTLTTFTIELQCNHSLFKNLTLSTGFLSSLNSDFWLNNCTFQQISCPGAFFSIESSRSGNITNSSFTQISNVYSFFTVTGVSLFALTNVYIKNSNSYTIFILTNVDANINTGLIVINNSFAFIFSTDHTCLSTELHFNLFEYNLIAKNFLILMTMNPIYFTCNNSYFSSNNFTSTNYMISMIVGVAQIHNSFFRWLFILDTKTFQNTFDFEIANQFFMTSCYFEDIGLVTRKTYYITKDNNAWISFWSMSFSSIASSVFIVTSLIDLVTGFIEAIPHGGLFECLGTTFIHLLDVNQDMVTGFRHKGILLDHFTEARLVGNQFYNLRCNTQTFYHMHGGVILAAASSLSYSKNSFIVEMSNNTFRNCFCDKVGALAIISISQVSLTNNSFINSTAKTYAGHLLIVGGDSLNITGLSLDTSAAGDGGALYIRSFSQAYLSFVTVTNAQALGSGVVYIKTVSSVTLFACEVVNSTAIASGGFMYLFQAVAFLISCRVANVSAVSDGGGVYLHGGSSLSIQDTYFIGCRSKQSSGGALFIANTISIQIINTTVDSCQSFLQGGALFIDVINGFSARQLTIRNSAALGNGIIFIKTEAEASTFNIDSLECLNTNATKGACLYFLSASSLTIQGLKVAGNQAMAIWLYWSFEIVVYFYDVEFSGTNINDNLGFFSGVRLIGSNWTFIDNTLVNLLELQTITGELSNMRIVNCSGDSAFLIEDAKILFSSMDISQNKGNTLSLLSLLRSQVQITSILMENAIASHKIMTFIYAGTSEIHVSGSIFSNNSGLILTGIQSNISITDSKFSGNTVLGDSGPSEVYCENCGFLNIESSLFLILQTSSLESRTTQNILIINSNFSQIGSSCFSTSITDSMGVAILNSSFIGFSNGNIKLFTKSQLTNLTISQSYFLNNSGNLGSAIYLSGDFHFSLMGSEFISNAALQGNITNIDGVAGCVFLKPSNDKLGFFKINRTKFYGNRAEFLASTVFSQRSITIANDTLSNNSDQAGPDLNFFSYPLNLVCLNGSAIPIVSGQAFLLELQLEDLFKKRLFFDNTTILLIKPKTSDSSNTIAIENSLVQSKAGNISFKGLIVKALPNSTVVLRISGTFMGLLDSSNLNPFTIQRDLVFNLRSCIIGEIILTDNSCNFCPKGSYSLIDPMTTELKYQKCYPCPENCFCYGGRYITPLPGYYRKSNLSISAVQCENIDACLGSPLEVYDENSLGILSNYSQGLCREGNVDALCYYCEFNYGKYEKTDYCKPCASVGMIVYVRLGFYILVMLLYIILNCHFAENIHLARKNKYANFSTFFKITVNHSQHITIILMSTGSFPFPNVDKVFSMSDYLSFSNDHVITNDCLIQQIYYNKETMIIFKEVFNTVLPIIFSLASFAFWVFLMYVLNNLNICLKFQQKIPNSIKAFLNKVLLFVVLCTFIFYSLIVKSCFGLFNCMTLDEHDGLTYLRESPNIQCWAADHLSYVFLFGLPALIAWGVVFPIFLFGVLTRNAKIVSFAEKTGLSSYTSHRTLQAKSQPNLQSQKQLPNPNPFKLPPSNNFVGGSPNLNFVGGNNPNLPSLNKYMDNSLDKKQAKMNKYIDNSPTNLEKKDTGMDIHVTAQIMAENPQEILERLASGNDSKELRKFKTKNEKLKYLNHILSNIEQSRIFVFFYKDYKPEYYFWECLIFFRKFILTFLSSMSESMSIEIIFMLMFIILFFFLLSTFARGPYKLGKANTVEEFSLIVCEVTIFSALVFKSTSPSAFQQLMAVVCLGFNVAFFVLVVMLGAFDAMRRVQALRKGKMLSLNGSTLKENDEKKEQKINSNDKKARASRVIKTKVVAIPLKVSKFEA